MRSIETQLLRRANYVSQNKFSFESPKYSTNRTYFLSFQKTVLIFSPNMFNETLIKAFPAPDLCCKTANFSATPYNPPEAVPILDTLNKKHYNFNNYDCTTRGDGAAF